MRRRLRRALAGAVRCAAWALVLWWLHRPWRHLGGLVHERLRWLETLVLLAGGLAGHTAGSLLRPWTRRPGRSRLQALRAAAYPALAAGALATAALERAGRWELLLIVFTGLLSYGAGLDLGLAALPFGSLDESATPGSDSG